MTTIDKIRAEIERRYEENREKARYDDYYRGMNDGLDLFESFLDTLEEPVSEDLEDEISRTYRDGSVTDTSDIDHVAYENIARHFAEWQKKQDMETIELAEDHAYFAGGINEREKIMKDAVEGKVIVPIYDEGDIWSTEIEIPGRYEPSGSKIKIIVVKEEEL